MCNCNSFSFDRFHLRPLAAQRELQWLNSIDHSFRGVNVNHKLKGAKITTKSFCFDNFCRFLSGTNSKVLNFQQGYMP